MVRVKHFLSTFMLIMLLATTNTCLNAAVTEYQASADLPGPHADLKPEDVVRIVIDALAHNDTPYVDAGIATTFNFASPANKINTGPLTRFTTMVKSGYGMMLDHQSSEFSEVVYKDSTAYMIVKLVASNGSEVAYAFRLSQQSEGEYQGMWMTDAVWQLSSQQSY